MRTIPMSVAVLLIVLCAGLAVGTAAAADDAHARTGPAAFAPDPPDDQADNATAIETSGDYQPIEPPRNWTKGPVLETEITPTFGIQDASQGLTRQFLTSGPEGYRLMTFERRAVGENVEVWVATNLSWGVAGNRTTPSISDAQVQRMVSEFDENIRPTETEIFGQPASRNGSEALIGPPGYYNTTEDAGNKTVLLVQNIRDQNYYNPDYPLYVAGYYSPTVQTYSDRNVITLDAYNWSAVTEEDPMVGYEGTLAHEYQHLIHADLDGDETSWVNEGMSDYAEYAVGYGAPEGHLSAYEQLPSNSLTNWEDQGAINVLADYGIAAAWTMYVDDRYGTEFIGNLADEDENGITGVQATLNETGARTDFYGLYQDFSTSVILDDETEHPRAERYGIAGTELAINTSGTPGTAGAWGTDYEAIDTSENGPIESVTVSGTNFTETQWTTTADPVTGEGEVLYSGAGNLLDRHAIVETDLSNATNPTLSFESFQRIEANWDYGFVQVSTDGGETWQSLANENTDASPAAGAHPRVVENLPGLTGNTDGWEEQTFDLSAYEGNDSVLVSFRYVTDWAAVEPGWYVRNVSVAGESVPTDTVEPYMSEREATGDLVEYQFTVVGMKKGGNVDVVQLDPITFPESGEKELDRVLKRGNFERVVVASTWAAEQGGGGRLPVDVAFEYRSDSGNGGGSPGAGGGPPDHANGGPGQDD